MKQVVSPYLPTIWASDITADFWTEGELLVTGKLPNEESEFQPSRDVFLRYRSSVKLEFGQKDTGRPSPHIIFANAVGDKALVDFVSEFGPVAAKAVEKGERPQPPTEGTSLEDFDKVDRRVSIGAVQDLATLRREREIYASALELLAELRRGEDAASVTVIKQHISVIAAGASYWPQQWEAEEQWCASHASRIAWHFDKSGSDYLWHLEFDAYHGKPPRLHSLAKQELDDPIDGTLTYFDVCDDPDDPSTWCGLFTRPYPAGHLVLCKLINAFDTEVWSFGDRPVEALPFNSLRFGIRPALYQILKHMYLGRAGAQVCRNDRCRQFFESKREGQIYCSTECSQQYRQREYWATSGSERRKKRRAKKGARNHKKRSR